MRPLLSPPRPLRLVRLALIDRPVYYMDEMYCCIGCTGNGPCICLYEADLADDGVDHLGMPFAIEPWWPRARSRPPIAPASGSPSASSTVPGTRCARSSRGSGAPASLAGRDAGSRCRA